MRAVIRVRQAIANLSLRRYGFETRPVEMVVVVDNMLLGLVPLEYVGFPLLMSFSQRSLLILSSVTVCNLSNRQHRQIAHSGIEGNRVPGSRLGFS